MKCYVLAILILILINVMINFMGGCGDGGSAVSSVTPLPSVKPSGTFSISVNIPGRKAEKVIPWNSKTLRVIITGSFIPTPLEGKAEIPSSGTVTLNITDVPVGMNVASIEILDPNGIVIARRKQGFYMGSNVTAKAENVSMGIGISSEGGLHCDPNVIEIKGGETLFFENQDLAGHSVKVNNTTINIYGVKEDPLGNQPSVYSSGSILFNVYGTYDILIGDYGVDPITPYGKVVVYKPLNPVITSFTPEMGTFGTSVKIYGTDFSDTPSDNIVKFNGLQSVVSSVGSGYLIASVPSGAKTGPISMSIRGSAVSTSSENFNVSDIFRISISSTGAEGDGSCNKASVSGDGRYVVFDSYSSNLVGTDPWGFSDVFIRDRVAGTTNLVYGIFGDSDSLNPYITPDGRFVECESSSTNWLPGGAGSSDIYHRDLVNNVLLRASSDSLWVEGGLDSRYPSVSDDGRFVAFESEATNLYSPDIAGYGDIFLKDVTTGTINRISWDIYMAEPDGDCVTPFISGNGQYVVFSSTATELVSGGTSNQQVFVWDKTAVTSNKISLVSVNNSGVQGNFDSYSPSITPDGRYVAFASLANNLVTGDTNGWIDVFVRDRVSGTTKRVSVSSSGVQGDYDSNLKESSLCISRDGRYVVFESTAENLVANDTNLVTDIFLHDLYTGKTIRLSVDKNSQQGNQLSQGASFAANSPIVVFMSGSALVSDDGNSLQDIYMRVFYP